MSKMIENLDKVAEANNTVRVLKVGHGVTPDRLREIIDAIQGQGSSGGAAPAATPPRISRAEAGLETSAERGGRTGPCLQRRLAPALTGSISPNSATQSGTPSSMQRRRIPFQAMSPARRHLAPKPVFVL